jgi:predicted transcriptional regulator
MEPCTLTAFAARIPDETAHKANQIAEVEAALAEADRGDFASAADLADVIGKYALHPLRSPIGNI